MGPVQRKDLTTVRTRGMNAEAMEEFESVTNKKLKTGVKKFKVVFLPMLPGQLQDRVSPRGTVGVMQVLPQYAAANPVNIPDVRDAQNNIHAGAKMLAQITKTYFNDPGIDQVNKTLFTFAAYNAGPNRIVRLRKQAQADGLDPNKWFGNVELIVAKDIGQETVQYVSNIYKYYVAYKMTLDIKRIHEQAKQILK
jgi:membrane-bound lytic murein transglycosylase MltF